MDNNIITHHGMDIEIQHRQSLGEARTLMHVVVVTALTITPDPVDGGTWGKHRGN